MSRAHRRTGPVLNWPAIARVVLPAVGGWAALIGLYALAHAIADLIRTW